MREPKIKKILKNNYYKITGTIRNKKIKNKNFTIISNNCWGGIIYRNFHIPYQSPTCGMFFMAQDYIKFIYNIKKYISFKIVKISVEESKYKEYLKNKNYNGIIGKIDDIEVCLVHYNTIEEANEKWIRRCKRINWNRIIYKFNDQNLCTYDELRKFQDFKAKNKICFTAKKYKNIDSIQLKQYSNNEFVISDTKEKDYNRYLNIVDMLNSI